MRQYVALFMSFCYSDRKPINRPSKQGQWSIPYSEIPIVERYNRQKNGAQP